MAERKSAIIISASSDIGASMALRWVGAGWDVAGTYRTSSGAVQKLLESGVRLVRCELGEAESVRKACARLRSLCPQWDVLVMAPGSQDPVGQFVRCDFDEWESSIRVNFTGQMRFVRELLPSRRAGTMPQPCVLMFAGGGTNSAPVNYSAYVVSKIALIKMCEILDAEIPDTRFVIVGPGWVKTKIHESTLRAGAGAGLNYKLTLEKMAGSECTPMEKVLDCCDWLVHAPREAVSGRNFSVIFDLYGDKKLERRLIADPDMYKLRRSGNDWRP